MWWWRKRCGLVSTPRYSRRRIPRSRPRPARTPAPSRKRSRKARMCRRRPAKRRPPWCGVIDTSGHGLFCTEMTRRPRITSKPAASSWRRPSTATPWPCMTWVGCLRTALAWRLTWSSPMRGMPRRSPPSRPWRGSAPTAMWSTASARCTPGGLGQSRMTLRRRSGSPRRQRVVTSTPNTPSPGSTAGARVCRKMLERRWSCIHSLRRRGSPTPLGNWENDTVTGLAVLWTDGRPPGISPQPMTDSGRWRISAPMTGSNTASAGCYSMA